METLTKLRAAAPDDTLTGADLLARSKRWARFGIDSEPHIRSAIAQVRRDVESWLPELDPVTLADAGWWFVDRLTVRPIAVFGPIASAGSRRFELRLAAEQPDAVATAVRLGPVIRTKLCLRARELDLREPEMLDAEPSLRPTITDARSPAAAPEPTATLESSLDPAQVLQAIAEVAETVPQVGRNGDRQIAQKHAAALILHDDLGIRATELGHHMGTAISTAQQCVTLARAKRLALAHGHNEARVQQGEMFREIYHAARKRLGLPKWSPPEEPAIERELGKPTVRRIIQAVASAATDLGFDADRMIGNERVSIECTQVRGALALLLREEGGMSLWQIADTIGLASHGSIPEALRHGDLKRRGQWCQGNPAREHAEHVFRAVYERARTNLGLPADWTKA